MKYKNYLLLMLLFISSISRSQNIPSYIPTNGLLAWWPFNGNANDESGNGNHGTVNGASLTADKNGYQNKAFSFDGNDCINIPNVVSSNSFSISIWLNSNDLSAGQQLIYYQGSREWELSNFNLNNGLKYLSGGVKLSDGLHYVNPGAYINNNSWYHCVLTYSQGNKVKIYINSHLVDSSSLTPNFSFFTGSATFSSIGAYNRDSRYFKGILDDIAIYNRVITPSEIVAMYTGINPCINFTNNFILQDTINACGGSQMLFINNSFDSYLWSTGSNKSYIDVNNSGWFSCKVTSGSCFGIDSVFVNLINVKIDISDTMIFKGDTINLSVSNSSIICRTAQEGNQISFSLPQGAVFSKINFASYGTPNGSCGNFSTGSCHYSLSKAVVENYLIGKSNAVIPATNSVFGDPCYGTLKRLYVEASYKQDNVSYFWSTGDTTESISVNPSTTTTYYCTVSNGISSCIDSVTVYVKNQIVSVSSSNGSISPSGTISVNPGSNQTYTFTPNSGYWIDSVIVNGVQVPTASSYTFKNVTSDQSIRVTYRSLAAALAAANICANDTLVSTVNLPAQSLVRATSYYSNIYLFNQNYTNNAHKYNVNDRKYTAIANKPTACIECGLAEANGKVYCFNTNGTTEAYDIASNTWQNKANQTSTSTSSVYTASINNKIYVLGYNNNQNTFIQYNPQTNSYTALANPTINTTQSRLVAYNNKLYKIGGTNNNSQPISSVEVYNPTNNTWTAMPDLPVALTQVGATNYDNKLYVFGGKQANNTNSNKVYVFDFTSNAWYQQSNTQNTNRTNIEAKTANNMVFLFGGNDTTNTTTNQAQRYFCKDQLCNCKWAEYVCGGVSSYVPCTSLTPSIQSLQHDTTANGGNLYNGIAASNVTVTLNYTGANGASYYSRIISSTGVSGLIATLVAGTLNNGNGTLVLTISGTPNTTGTASFSIAIGGKTCVFTRVVKNLTVGSVFGGGKVAYILEPGDLGYDANKIHGIIAAPNDCNVNANGCQYWGCGYSWGCDGTSMGTATAIGTGAANTALIVSGCSQYSAAKACNDLVVNGFDDWYLPSEQELKKLVLNRSYIDLSCGYGQPYWSSSESNIDNKTLAIAVTVCSQVSWYYVKNPNISWFLVRAVRSF